MRSTGLSFDESFEPHALCVPRRLHLFAFYEREADEG